MRKIGDLVRDFISHFDMGLGWYKVTLYHGGIRYDYKIEAYDIDEAQDKALSRAVLETYIYPAEWDEIEAIYIGKERGI